MAKLYGDQGSVSLATGNVGDVKGWVIDTKADIEDVTDFTAAATGWKDKHAGLKEWSGSLEAIMNDTSAHVIAGATGTITVTAKTGKTYTGSIIVESTSSKGSADGKSVELSVKFEGTGALTLPALP